MREMTEEHWTDGGTAVTNFSEERLYLYEIACKVYGDSTVKVGPPMRPINGMKGWYALHHCEFGSVRRDLSAFWRVFNQVCGYINPYMRTRNGCPKQEAD